MTQQGTWISVDEPVPAHGWYAVLCLAENGQVFAAAAYHHPIKGWGLTHNVFARSPQIFATQFGALKHATQNHIS